MVFSVAMPSGLHGQLVDHVDRPDGQEDLCFVLWHPSRGSERSTAVLREVVLPRDGDRQVHGNVSFNSQYFMRACDLAASTGGGVALVHSHPGGTGWQGLSTDDFHAEASHAGRAQALTNMPMIGLTLATGDMTMSAREWIRSDARTYEPHWARDVRVVGDRWFASRNPRLFEYDFGAAQSRSLATWGDDVQQTLDGLHVGVVGAGSVGSLVIESLARIGVGRISIIDFDTVKERNLDRLLHARRLDAWLYSSKASVARRAARDAATSRSSAITAHEVSVVEREGLTAALECDILFSCVDRPAGRATLNALAFAHCIPVVDGGILVDARDGRLRSAQWRSHVAAPGRRCLECLAQFDSALVQTDRDGLLDDPSYLRQLPADHLVRRGENVFAFSAAAAADEVLAMLRMIIAPGGYADAGAQHVHFTTGDVDTDPRGCDPSCPYDAMTAAGDSAGAPVASRHLAAEKERRERHDRQRRITVRLLQKADTALWSSHALLERVAVRLNERRDR